MSWRLRLVLAYEHKAKRPDHRAKLPAPFDRRVWQEATSLCRHGLRSRRQSALKKGRCTASYERLEGVDIIAIRSLYEANQGVLGYFVEFVYCGWLPCGRPPKAYSTGRSKPSMPAIRPTPFSPWRMLFRPLGVKFVFDHHDLCPEMFIAKGRRRTGLSIGALAAGKLTLPLCGRRHRRKRIASHDCCSRGRGRRERSHGCAEWSSQRRAWAEINWPSPGLKLGRTST